MATATGTLALNAAFLQEIKEDNSALRSLFELLREIATDSVAVDRHIATFLRALGALRDQLAVHFALEEAFGYFEDAIAQAPRLCDQAETLRAEHDGLFKSACEMAEEAEQCRYGKHPHRDARRLATQFLRFNFRFLQHEARENDLILQAFDDDIGVGD